jgi:hypothetical protein
MAERAAMTPSRFQSGPPPKPASRAPMAFNPVVQPQAKAEPVKIVKGTSVPVADLPESFKQVVESAPQATQASKVSSGTKKGQGTRKQAPAGQTGPRMATRSSVKTEAPRSQTPTVAPRKNPPRQATRVNQDDGSRAGGFRGETGSGQTEIGVDPVGPPSKP